MFSGEVALGWSSCSLVVPARLQLPSSTCPSSCGSRGPAAGAVALPGCRALARPLPGPGAARPGRLLRSCAGRDRRGQQLPATTPGLGVADGTFKGERLNFGAFQPDQMLALSAVLLPPCPLCCRLHAPPFPQRVAQGFGIYSSSCAPRMKQSCQQPLTKEGC